MQALPTQGRGYPVNAADMRRWAGDNGYTFTWADDWDLGMSHAKFYGPGSAYDDCANGEPDTCEVVTMHDADGNIVASLGCVDGADGAYRAEVESDLAAEVYPDWQRAARRARSGARARRRALKRTP